MLVQATACGLSLADFEYLSIGMIVDFVQEYMELNDLISEDAEYIGTAEDFESMFFSG